LVRDEYHQAPARSLNRVIALAHVVQRAEFMAGNLEEAQRWCDAIHAADGSHLTRLTTGANPPVNGPDGTCGGGDWPGDYSPDGKHFVFLRTRCGELPAPDRTQTGALFVANADGTDLRQLTPYGPCTLDRLVRLVPARVSSRSTWPWLTSIPRRPNSAAICRLLQ
jgi:hypothetical protein